MPLVVPFNCIILSVNKFLNLKKRNRLPRLTSLSALLTVNQCRYAIPLRYAIKAALGISIFPFFPCPARTKGISFLAISCRMVNSFSPRISCVHSLMVSISTGCSAELATGISSSSSSLLRNEVTFAIISCFLAWVILLDLYCCWYNKQERPKKKFSGRLFY